MCKIGWNRSDWAVGAIGRVAVYTEQIDDEKGADRSDGEIDSRKGGNSYSPIPSSDADGTLERAPQ